RRAPREGGNAGLLRHDKRRLIAYTLHEVLYQLDILILRTPYQAHRTMHSQTEPRDIQCVEQPYAFSQSGRHGDDKIGALDEPRTGVNKRRLDQHRRALKPQRFKGKVHALAYGAGRGRRYPWETQRFIPAYLR